MMKLNEYLNDGADYQSVCVMAYIRNCYEGIIDEGYDEKVYSYNHAKIEVSRYHNCREQGYTLCLMYDHAPITYITFFEHRNTDHICLLINKDKAFSECPTPDEVWGNRKDKWDFDKDFDCMQIEECGNYIIKLMKDELHRVVEENEIIKDYINKHPEERYLVAEKRKQIIADALGVEKK